MASFARQLLLRGVRPLASLPPTTRVAACQSSARLLCSASPLAGERKPGEPIKLFQPPPLSPRRERIKKYGLIGLTHEFVKQQVREQTGEAGTVDNAFRVQTYTVPLNRPAEFALSKVFGFGRSRSKWLAAEVGVFGNYKLSKMRESQRTHIRRALNSACVAYDDPSNAAGAALKKEIGLNIQRLKDIRSYRGIRHELRYPCRGQRTKTNAKTRRRMNHGL